ncbi:MAG TPA: hypothetical protein VMV24_00275 [Candidatus Dormibacteraeota bacterium]|nr:hypothetical protein [Candidatus Dormibacteraeota bacterium]
MELEKATEQQTGEVRFSHINLMPQNDWKKIREYILVSSRGYDNQAIKTQLEIDSNPEYQDQSVPISRGMAINPIYLIINFEYDNIRSIGMDTPLIDFLEVIFDTDEDYTNIINSENEDLKTSLKNLFDNDPILKSLFDELQKTGTSLDQKELNALSRAIMTQRALLILLNYPDLI